MVRVLILNGWLKFRGHLDIVEEEQTKNKQKMLPALLLYQVTFTLK